MRDLIFVLRVDSGRVREARVMAGKRKNKTPTGTVEKPKKLEIARAVKPEIRAVFWRSNSDRGEDLRLRGRAR